MHIDMLAQALAMANDLLKLSVVKREDALTKLRRENQTMHALVLRKLQELRNEA